MSAFFQLASFSFSLFVRLTSHRNFVLVCACARACVCVCVCAVGLFQNDSRNERRTRADSSPLDVEVCDKDESVFKDEENGIKNAKSKC